jgi:hypothetical protein
LGVNTKRKRIQLEYCIENTIEIGGSVSKKNKKNIKNLFIDYMSQKELSDYIIFSKRALSFKKKDLYKKEKNP